MSSGVYLLLHLLLGHVAFHNLESKNLLGTAQLAFIADSETSSSKKSTCVVDCSIMAIGTRGLKNLRGWWGRMVLFSL